MEEDREALISDAAAPSPFISNENLGQHPGSSRRGSSHSRLSPCHSSHPSPSPRPSPNFSLHRRPRSILLSAGSIPSCHSTPRLQRAVSQLSETDSHLARLTESIKYALVDTPVIRQRYFPTRSTHGSVTDSPQPLTPTEPDLANHSGEPSTTDVFLKSSDSLAYEKRGASTLNAQANRGSNLGLAGSEDKVKPLSSTSQATEFEYSPEKANEWVELTNIDTNPVLPQRKSRTFCESAQEVLQKLDPVTLQRYSSVGKRAPPRLNSPAALACDPPKIRETKDPNLPSLKFKFQYLIVTERLKVTVVEATKLLISGKVDGEAYTYSEVCLMPGKLQRQQSKVVKVAKTSVYDCVVYFNGLSLFEMHQMCLRIKIMRKESRLKTPKVIGEITVSLVDFDLVSETVLDENFNTRIGSRSGSKFGPRSVAVQ